MIISILKRSRALLRQGEHCVSFPSAIRAVCDAPAQTASRMDPAVKSVPILLFSTCPHTSIFSAIQNVKWFLYRVLLCFRLCCGSGQCRSASDRHVRKALRHAPGPSVAADAPEWQSGLRCAVSPPGAPAKQPQAKPGRICHPALPAAVLLFSAFSLFRPSFIPFPENRQEKAAVPSAAPSPAAPAVLPGGGKRDLGHPITSHLYVLWDPHHPAGDWGSSRIHSPVSSFHTARTVAYSPFS